MEKEHICEDCSSTEDVFLRQCPLDEALMNEDRYYYLCKKCLNNRFDKIILYKAES